MSKHTPGPWELDYDTRPAEVCTIYNTPNQPSEDGLGQRFVYVRGPIGYWEADEDENLANAKLIAAAPDLLEALQIWMRFFDEMPKGQFGKIVCDIGLMNDGFIKTRQAIKKAEG